MTLLKSFFLIILMLIGAVKAEITMSGEEDILFTVSQKLIQIEQHLKDQRLFVSSASFNWPELNEFRDVMMFVVAHDPSGSVAKDIPNELQPFRLTQRLRLALSELEASVYKIENLVKTDEWNFFKSDLKSF